jgi:hypothetical protein
MCMQHACSGITPLHLSITRRLAGRKQGRHARFGSSGALAEQPAVARTAVELHGCCARTSLAAALLSQHVDCVTRAPGSLGTESGSRARCLVLHTIACWRPSREAHGLRDQLYRARRRIRTGTQNSRWATAQQHRQLSSPCSSGRRFASLPRQRDPAGPPSSSLYVFRADTRHPLFMSLLPGCLAFGRARRVGGGGWGARSYSIVRINSINTKHTKHVQAGKTNAVAGYHLTPKSSQGPALL